MRGITTVFWAAAISYLAMLPLSGYDAQPAHKALPIFILLIWLWRQPVARKPLVLAAIGFSSLGDIFLALTFSFNFQAGLLAFAFAQLCYAVFFFSSPNWARAKRLPVALIVVTFCLVGGVVVPTTGELMWLVLFYTSTLMLMTCGSVVWTNGVAQTAIGAGVFVLSDSLIAINKFVMPLPYESFLIMVTYYLAQYLIVTGIAKQELAVTEVAKAN